jgi:hypothetical protein
VARAVVRNGRQIAYVREGAGGYGDYMRHMADIEAVPELLPEVWEATPLRVISFLEMTGVKSRRAPQDILRESTEKIESLAQYRNSMGLSPHAPYSTTPELLQLSGQIGICNPHGNKLLGLFRIVTESAEFFGRENLLEPLRLYLTAHRLIADRDIGE